MTKLAIYFVTWISACVTLAATLPDIHHKMTPSQLQEVFHVVHKDLVPNYEIVSLNHHVSHNHHSINRRSINSDNLLHKNNKVSSVVSESSGKSKVVSKNNHHVKKDLSKIPFDINSISYEEKKSFQNYDLKQINEHNVSFSAFGENLNLTLKPTEGLFRDGPNSLKMWHVRPDANASQGVTYERIEDNSEDIGDIFQDPKNMAAILLRKHLQSGDLLMEGSVGHELIIRPVPLDVSRADDGSVHHVIYKRDSERQLDEQLSDFAYMEPDRLQKRYKRSSEAEAENFERTRSKRDIPNVIYPEILVIVDYDGYRLHGGDNVQIKRYFVSFWNGVDLRYRLLKGPKIRISIAGIIISRGRDATPYLERNRVGRDAIDSAAALTDMGKYLFRERRLPVYDIAVAITKYDMCRRRKGGRCTKGTAGFAYVAGACVVNKRLEKVNSVAIIEDTGGFSGIIVAAHEIGHLLGAVHDGSPPPSYLGGPGAEKCRWEDGYIMSDLRHTERGFRWSACSVQSFHHFLNGDTASCLHNAPHEDEALGRQLPGTLLSLDAQCRRDRGTSACFKDERVCAQLFCFDASSGYCVAYRPAAEGSTCGDGQHCLDGKCVAENENIIPDYSQHTASYISPNSFNSQFQNDLRKALNENDESSASTSSIDTTKSYAPTTTSTTPSTTTSTTESTTKSTTTTTTTTTVQRSTTTALVTTKRYPLWKNSDEVPKTPKTYFSNSFYQNNSNKNQNNINGPTYDTKSPFIEIVTKRPSSDNDNDSDISSPTKPATSPTINPFYYGFNRLPRYSITSRYNTQQYNTKLSTTTITPQSPPSTIKPSTINNNKNIRTPYQIHHYYFTSTKKPDLLASPPTYATNYEVDNNYHENKNDDIVETEKPKSSTYNPVFDIYFKQIARQRTAVPKIG